MAPLPLIRQDRKTSQRPELAPASFIFFLEIQTPALRGAPV